MSNINKTSFSTTIQPIKVNTEKNKITQDFREIEKQKLTTFNPLINSNIRFKKIYWNSKMEIAARLILLAISLFLIISMVFFVKNIINQLNTVQHAIIDNNYKENYSIYIAIAFSFAFNLLFYLPIAICRNAETLYHWAIFYIFLAIFYFIVMEVLYTAFLVVNGIINTNVLTSIPVFMILTLLITVTWMFAACLLIVKTDDIRKQISVE